MPRYARVVAGEVVEVIDVPAGQDIEKAFHPEIAATLVPCGNEVRQRMRHDGKAFAPEPEPDAPPAEAVLAASDARAARKVEDILDILIEKGVLEKRDLPEATAAWLDDRKALRGEIARKG